MGNAVKQSQQEVDRILAEQAGRGDLKAMEQIYTKYSGLVYSMALRLTGRHSDAEDIVQETFVKVWTAIRRFRGDGLLRSWLLGIGVNLCRDTLRRRSKVVPLFDDETVASWDGDLLIRRWLQQGLLALPEGYREVLTLHDVLGLKHSEIADLLGIAVGTSKSQLHKARANLRTILKQKQGRRALVHRGRNSE